MQRTLGFVMIVGMAAAGCTASGVDPASHQSANLDPSEGVWEFIYLMQAGSSDQACLDATRRQAEASVYVDRDTPDEAQLFSVPDDVGGAAPAHPAGADNGTGVFLSQSWHTLYVPGGTDELGNDAPLTIYEYSEATDPPTFTAATDLLVTPNDDGFDDHFYFILDGNCPDAS
jgi:hypothetical protein